MQLMLPSARREDGAKQPCIKIWKFDLRIPFIHYEWEIPEMIQACVVFMTGSATTMSPAPREPTPWSVWN